MKSTLTLFVALFISMATFAQKGINYKAVIRDNSGNVLTNQNIKLRFSIESLSYGIIYQETHNTMTDANGIVIVSIGSGTENVFNNFVTIDWGSDHYSLTTEIDPEPYGVFVVMGTTPFQTVPYAKYSEIAENVFSGDYNDLTNQPVITSATGLEKITENSNTGWRLVGTNSNNYGFIGSNAVDLSISQVASNTHGATGDQATALGVNTVATGNNSSAMGIFTVASGERSTAMGNGSEASGFISTAMGSNTEASGDNSTAIGNYAIASGNSSIAIGSYLIAPSNSEIVIGSLNTLYTPVNGSNSEWNPTDRLFVIGNSNNFSIRSNALTVLKNAKTGINTANPQSMFEVVHANILPTPTNRTNALSITNSSSNKSFQLATHNNGSLTLYSDGNYLGYFNNASGVYTVISDRRTKKDIISLENGTLNKVMQLNPVSYLMKDQTDTKRNLGLISQEVQKLFPSITHYVEESDLLTLSYTELIPILIKALQEQQGIIDAQKAKDVVQDKSVEALSADNSSLKNTLNNLISRVEKIEANNQ